MLGGLIEIRRKRRSLQECYNFLEFGPGGFEVVEEAILIEAAGMAVVLESQGLCGLAMDRRRREKEAIAVVTMGCAGEEGIGHLVDDGVAVEGGRRVRRVLRTAASTLEVRD